MPGEQDDNRAERIRQVIKALNEALRLCQAYLKEIEAGKGDSLFR